MRWIKKNNVKVNNDQLLIEKLAKVRGIKDINEWINPPSKYAHSPYLLDDIDRAVEEIVWAVHAKKKIQIVADIDTDGVCSAAIMYNYLIGLTDNINIIHSQRSLGHGVEQVFDKFDEDLNLLIIVDSSSNSVHACMELEDRGIKVVIIDHHKINVQNPHAIIVNCQKGSYPNKHLSGSAMVYKVCQVLDEYLGIDWADNFLDLAAIGLVADMMDIRNMENRYLIYNGVNRIVNTGVKSILRQSKIEYNEGITTTNISFKIAPIIGACSRFDKIELAIDLLTTDTDEIDVADELTKVMISMNEKRKSNQKEYISNAKQSINTDNNIIMYVDGQISSGFRGLIATEFVELFSKPVFVLAYNPNTDMYGGSARGIGVLPLQSICESSGLFTLAQGHESAFGVEFKGENLPKIIDFFNETLNSEDLQKVIEYDLELGVSEIEEMDIRQVEKFSKICGQGFPEPIFLIKGLVVEEGYTKKLGTHVRAVMGANKDTIKIKCENDFALMKFRSNEEYAKEIEDHFKDERNFLTELDVVGSLNLNNYYNFGAKKMEITKQIFLHDFKITE